MGEAALGLPVFDRPVKLLIVSAVGEKAAARVAIARSRAVGCESDVVAVPSALEVPVVIAMAERLAEYDGYVALAEDSDVSSEAWRSISLLGLQGLCIGNGIGLEPGQAAFAALHLIAISRKWAAKTKGIGFRA
ncbi:MAG: 6,7-dimethyl-8-ribityllumazine synthase [Alphaproteobacteria bacterium]|jgi:6,7-dimethyl-8-ribityllumazine synthase